MPGKYDMMKLITDDFCDAFIGCTDYTNATCRIIAMWEIPEGVDKTDSRVIEIVKNCQDAIADQKEMAMMDEWRGRGLRNENGMERE